MNNQYTYNGTTYQLKPLILSVMKKAMPVIVKLRKLQYEYTKDIDMNDVNSEKNRLAELETAKKQLQELMLEDISNNKRIEIADKIFELNDMIQSTKDELNFNESYKQKIKLYNECSAIALYEIITDTELITPFIKSILTSGSGREINIDLSEPGAIEFVSAVFKDFFLLIPKNKMKLKS